MGFINKDVLSELSSLAKGVAQGLKFHGILAFASLLCFCYYRDYYEIAQCAWHLCNSLHVILNQRVHRLYQML